MSSKTSHDIKNCDLRKVYFNKGLASNSSSSSDIYIVTVDGVECIMKVFISRIDAYIFNKNMLYEIDIYKTTNTILDSHESPNFVRAVGYSSSCSINTVCNMIYNCSAEVRQGIVSNLFVSTCVPNTNRPSVTNTGPEPDTNTLCNNSVLTKDNLSITFGEFKQMVYQDKIRLGYIITEKSVPLDNKFGKITTFHDLLNHNIRDSSTDPELYANTFQILCALYIMERRGINHNDIHTGNILLNNTPVEAAFIWLPPYAVNADRFIVYFVKSNMLPLVYDFDRADELGLTNPYIEMYSPGQSTFVKNKDYIKLMCYIISLKSNSQNGKEFMDGFNRARGVSKDEKQFTEQNKVLNDLLKNRCFSKYLEDDNTMSNFPDTSVFLREFGSDIGMLSVDGEKVIKREEKIYQQFRNWVQDQDSSSKNFYVMHENAIIREEVLEKIYSIVYT